MLGRFPKAKNPKKDMNACTDILFTVLKGHYVAYACMLLGISKPTEYPKDRVVPRGKSAKLAFIAKIAAQVAEKFSIIEDAIVGKEVLQTKDAMFDYAKVFCHFGSLALEFKNAWEEGDGERTICCWKVFLLHFRASGCIKYAWEALRLQFQLVFLPPALSHQIKWERYINTHTYQPSRFLGIIPSFGLLIPGSRFCSKNPGKSSYLAAAYLLKFNFLQL